MRRLTQKDSQGNWGLNGMPWKNLYTGQMITKEVEQVVYGALCKLKDYEESGLDPEEVEDLVKKNQAQEPMLEGDGCDRDGNIILDEWLCPRCGSRYEVDYDRYDFCPNCGQRINWE